MYTMKKTSVKTPLMIMSDRIRVAKRHRDFKGGTRRKRGGGNEKKKEEGRTGRRLCRERRNIRNI